ncbi:MAG: valine--tRNA ligase [Candidatus Omnitrophica bacterium]|nr:valine--tRNA ligase [Candidatus Omnitrophota bacterium]
MNQTDPAAQELPSAYSPKAVEDKWYSLWESCGLFTPQRTDAPPYTIVIPPPNVTGILHMGHALNNTIQDILIRWKRMAGAPALWVPGTDHAGIATQNVVEKKLAREKKTRFDLGREKFVEEVWRWKKEYGSTIVRQLRKLGSSCDWSRERFTMDEGLSRAVRHAFVRLYEDGLIYQGHRIINWCPRCQTALSDEEAPYQEVEGKLYYYHYLSKDPATGALVKDEKIIIATTRPETMLGDTALAVNPKDRRYKKLEGKEIYLPLQDRRLAFIKDPLIDPKFGTGIVKVTPAHDPNDFVMGERHRLASINVLHPDARVNENGAPYQGLDRFEARKRILADLKEKGLFVKEEPHRHKVPHCYRCHTVVEPYLSKQWFVRMKPLAEKALQAQEEKRIRFYPQRWTKVYLHWLNNIQDWCISRQIWWGHQIPVWFCGSCQKPYASVTDLTSCPSCHGADLKQDPDVLDTWFSSWLWPFSTLGWPDDTADLKYFYPTSALATAQEIIFFWVARMIMAGLYFMKEVPFRDVYIHGTVRTDSGQKMSKSLGNAIDPLELISEIGADALRFSIVMLTASGQDAYLSKEKFELGRNFTNKIWNAARFSFSNLKDFRALQPGFLPPLKGLGVVDRWIVSRLEHVIREVDGALAAYRFNDAASALYHFFWHDFCDWYLELSKPVFYGEDRPAKEKTSAVLLFVLETYLRLLHPFMPFLAEELWQKLRAYYRDTQSMPESILTAAWPGFERKKVSAPAEFEMGLMQQAIGGIRDLRAKLNIPPAKPIEAVVRVADPGLLEKIGRFDAAIRHLARLESLSIVTEFERRPTHLSNVFKEMEIFVRVEGVVDLAAERARILKKIEEVSKLLDQLAHRLSNADFISRAPEEVVEKERARQTELQKILGDLKDNLALFESVR